MPGFFKETGHLYLPNPNRSPVFRSGRGGRIRTGDPLVPNQVRYQAALRPAARVIRLYRRILYTISSIL